MGWDEDPVTGRYVVPGSYPYSREADASRSRRILNNQEEVPKLPSSLKTGDDFSGQVVTDFTFRDRDISKINFSGCTFTDSEFVNCSLDGVSLQGIQGSDLAITNCSLSGTVMSKAVHPGLTVSRTMLTDAHLQIGLFRRGKWSEVNAIKCSFFRSDLSSSHFSNITFADSDFSGTLLRDVVATDVVFDHSQMPYANLTGAHLLRCHFDRSQLGYLDFTGARLSRCHFDGCDLSFVNFSRTSFEEVTFSRCRFRGSKFKGTKLSGNVLHELDFSQIVFDDVDLSGAQLQGADLSGSRWYRSNLAGANFSGSNLSGASFLSVDASGSNLSHVTGLKIDIQKSDLSNSLVAGADFSGGFFYKNDFSGVERTSAKHWPGIR